LSSAALETLSIIAYKQLVTKGEIESIRGVSSDYAVQKLLEKELIIISGRNEKMPGHPLVYSTSKNFMDYFGINSAEDLPKIKEVLADQVVEPTIIKDAEISEERNNEGPEDNAPISLAEEEIKAEGTEDETMLSVTEEEAKAEGADNDVMLSVTEDGELVDKVQGEDQD
jgi:segregation and condensation protein B